VHQRVRMIARTTLRHAARPSSREASGGMPEPLGNAMYRATNASRSEAKSLSSHRKIFCATRTRNASSLGGTCPSAIGNVEQPFDQINAASRADPRTIWRMRAPVILKAGHIKCRAKLNNPRSTLLVRPGNLEHPLTKAVYLVSGQPAASALGHLAPGQITAMVKATDLSGGVRRTGRKRPTSPSPGGER